MLRLQHLSNQGPPLKKPPLHEFLTKTTSDFILQFDSDWPFQNSHCGKPGRRQHFPTPDSDRPLGKPQLHNPSTAISSAYADLVFPTTTLHDHRLGSAIRETPVARSRIETGSALNLRRCMRRNEPVPVSDRPLRRTPVAQLEHETGSALRLPRCQRRPGPVPVSNQPLGRPQLHDPNTATGSVQRLPRC